MLTATKGTAVLNTIFREYAAWCGNILTRENGSLVGHETGQACPFTCYSGSQHGRPMRLW